MTAPDDSEQFYTHPNDIYRVLRALQLSRSLLQVRFPHSQTLYSSLLIEIDMDNQLFVIDALNPEIGNPKLESGEPFTVIGYYDGVQVVFRDNLIEPEPPALYTEAYTVRFPAEVYYKQRRHAFRVQIPRIKLAEATLGNSDRQKAINGRLADLSTGGFAVEFDGQPDPALKRNENFSDCRLWVSSELDFTGQCRAHQPRYDPVRDLTLCGFELINTAPRELRKLERYTLQLQRQQRRLGLQRPGWIGSEAIRADRL